MVVGGLGEVLITVGVLGLLFVAWELWWTGLDAERDREESAEEYYAGIETYRPEEQEADFDVCYTLEDGTEIGCAPSMHDRADGVSTMGMAYVPRLGEGWATPIRHGTGPEQIDRGALGHYVSTQMPDEPGNFALAGHRQTNGNMLGNQDDLESGDRIYIEVAEGIFVYEVAEREVVLPMRPAC
ncbi:sortase [Nesterenkonia pannonica]|uniref:sortase domain-containing protein n=1 Tax=Nesterenkonia pannonica TaxID=1548602 RepID=UPI002164EE01|nr:sortase [Nesterenkonia pannonica]